VEQSSWPACVGLSKTVKYGRVHTVWNDMKNSFQPTPWYMRLIPMKYIKWDRNGSYLFYGTSKNIRN
jgi:hypothetical protein